MTDLPPLPCYLNGQYTPLPEAKISVMDRGFIFGDGVYEVIPAYQGALFRFDDHMARLDRSLAELRMANPLAHAQWRAIAERLLGEHRASIPAGEPPAEVQSVYIQVTRGVALRNHVMPTGIPPTVFMLADRMGLPTPQQQDQGVACITADDFRWQKAHIKSTSLLGAVFARQLSYDVGAIETVMFRDGWLSEAAASNIWVVKNGSLAGVPKNNLALTGVRYGLIAEICEAQGIPFELRRISRDEVLAADELILSSAVREVLAIVTLDGQPVANGRPGPIYKQLQAGYAQAKQRSIEQHKASV
jgi:D-alanine transaminase